MEGTLQGRAEYAGILADLGFLPVSYVASCRNGAQELDSHYDECSLNARVIKAAICAGERRLSCYDAMVFGTASLPFWHSSVICSTQAA